jgi:hypothetical protein
MKTTIFEIVFLLLLLIIGSASQEAKAQQIGNFRYTGLPSTFGKFTVENNQQFHGYTTYWHDNYRTWYQFGNLLKMSVPNVKKTLKQSKINIAADLGIRGLFVEPGFVNGLLAGGSYISLQNPSAKDLKSALAKEGNVLIYLDPSSKLGHQLMSKLPAEATQWRHTLGALQYNSLNLAEVDAFYLGSGNKRIYVVASPSESARKHLKQLIKRTKELLQHYKLKKGFFGVATLLKSVTSTKGFPLDVIGKGMNEGASWFVFDGYMGFRMKKHHELENWLKEVNSSVVTDLGTDGLFGCKNYKGFQIQMMGYINSTETYFNYARQHGCYAFRRVYAPKDDPYPYVGYIARAGNKEVIDTSSVPFVLPTGNLLGGMVRSMVLFVPKSVNFTKKRMWYAIMDRRAVGVLKRGKMMGSAKYRLPLELLVLDQVYLEQHFGDHINLRAKTVGDTLHVEIKNYYSHPVKGKLTLQLPSTLKLNKNLTSELTLPAGKAKPLTFKLNATASAMNKRNPIAIHFQWNGHKKGTITKLRLPPAISVYRLLYGESPTVKYPVSIHNFTSKTSYPVTVKVLKKGGNHRTVYQMSQTGSAQPGHYQDMTFHLKVPPGKYQVKVSALDQHYTSQLGVGGPKIDGTGARAYAVDSNGDGINEYWMENDSVQVTLLTTGARIIQYIVKSQHKDEFLQVWPRKPSDSTKAYRKCKYYPFGGFEDFLGQPSLETFKNYHAKIIKKMGNYVQVRMSAEYYGNTITKTFTLYGDSPLVGIRYRLNFITPSTHMLGPEPLLRLDDGRTQTIIIPTVKGIQYYKPKKSKWGKVFDLKDGWNAGYSLKRNLSWIGAFPVSQPIFLHMWFNTPANEASHYTYNELQPWTPIFKKSTWYFSYYMWGAGGPWETSLKALRQRNLITHSHN